MTGRSPPSSSKRDMDQLTKALLGPRTCPEEVATALQAIDPDAELLHLGGTKWWLGVAAPNDRAREILESGELFQGKVSAMGVEDPVERAMAQVELEKEYTMFQIMASGFRPIALYDLSDPDWSFGAIVEDFRIRDHNWRNQTANEHAEDIRDATSMERQNRSRIAEAAQRMKDAASEAYAFIFKGRRSVGGGRLPNHEPGERRGTRPLATDNRSSSS